MSRLRRFQNTAEISGSSLGTTPSRSMMEASVSSWCALSPRASAALSMSGVSWPRIRVTMRSRISSGGTPLTNW